MVTVLCRTKQLIFSYFRPIVNERIRLFFSTFFVGSVSRPVFYLAVFLKLIFAKTYTKKHGKQINRRVLIVIIDSFCAFYCAIYQKVALPIRIAGKKKAFRFTLFLFSSKYAIIGYR